jgi:5-formyltetrahydrofolate cyclo-ligase
MTSAQRETASREICSRLRQQVIWQSAGAILFFAPTADEPDIWPLVEECLAAGKTVGLPRFAAGRSGYVAGQVRDLARDIQLGKFQIREPAGDCPELALSQFDLILVPGVAFDHKGRRLGRGQGYYDRWLKDAQGARLCGVAFSEQWLEEIPAEGHDVTMQFVVTPTGFFRCGK